MSKTDLIYDLVQKVDNKIDKLDDRIDCIEKDVHKNTVDLKEHMRRTEINEENINLIHQKMSWKYLLKTTTMVATSIGTIAGAIAKIFGAI